MKTVITIFTLVLIITSCNQQGKLKVVLSKFPNDSIEEIIYYDLPITADSTGIKEIYFNNGKLHARGGYKKGNRNGKWVCYRKDGQLEWRSDYTDGVENGTIECFEENGSWTKTTMINGCKQGVSTEYNRNSTGRETWVTGQYKDCKETGLWTWKNKKNIVVTKMFYNNGKPDKYCEEFDSTGILIKRSILNQGQIDTLFYFDRNGKIIKTETFHSGETIHLE